MDAKYNRTTSEVQARTKVTTIWISPVAVVANTTKTSGVFTTGFILGKNNYKNKVKMMVQMQLSIQKNVNPPFNILSNL